MESKQVSKFFDTFNISLFEARLFECWSWTLNFLHSSVTMCWKLPPDTGNIEVVPCAGWFPKNSDDFVGFDISPGLGACSGDIGGFPSLRWVFAGDYHHTQEMLKLSTFCSGMSPLPVVPHNILDNFDSLNISQVWDLFVKNGSKVFPLL